MLDISSDTATATATATVCENLATAWCGSGIANVSY